MRGRLAQEAEPDPYTRQTVNLFQAPGPAASLLSLLALVWLAPDGGAPAILYSVQDVPLLRALGFYRLEA